MGESAKKFNFVFSALEKTRLERLKKYCGRFYGNRGDLGVGEKGDASEKLAIGMEGRFEIAGSEFGASIGMESGGRGGVGGGDRSRRH
jgi:hypothetical protein